MKLIGYLDGIEVKFDFYPPNTFKAEVPKRIDGTYIIELHAADDAGNITNYSNLFVKIDFNLLKISILPFNFSDKTYQENNHIIEITSNFSFKEIFKLFINREVPARYSFKELII